MSICAFGFRHSMTSCHRLGSASPRTPRRFDSSRPSWSRPLWSLVVDCGIAAVHDGNDALHGLPLLLRRHVDLVTDTHRLRERASRSADTPSSAVAWLSNADPTRDTHPAHAARSTRPPGSGRTASAAMRTPARPARRSKMLRCCAKYAQSEPPIEMPSTPTRWPKPKARSTASFALATTASAVSLSEPLGHAILVAVLRRTRQRTRSRRAPAASEQTSKTAPGCWCIRETARRPTACVSPQS